MQTSGDYAGYIKYTVAVVTTKGTSSDITLTDKFTGVNSFSADQMKGWAVTYNGAVGNKDSNDTTKGPYPEYADLTKLTPTYSNTGDNKGWSVTLPQVKNDPAPYYGQYTITYYVKPDASSTADGEQNVTNTAQAHDDYHWPSASTTTHLRSGYIKKNGSTDTTNHRISWTISVHKPSHEGNRNFAGDQFKDILTENGDKLDTSEIYVLDENGNKVSSTMYLADANGNIITDYSGKRVSVTVAEDGSFTFPEGSYFDQNYKFIYYTDYEEGAKNTKKDIKNTIEYTRDNHTYSDSNDQWIEGTKVVYDVNKWYEANGYQEASDGSSANLQWSSKIFLPEEDITSDKVTYTDTLTAAGGNNYDTAVDGAHYTTAAQLKDINVYTLTKDGQNGENLTLNTDFEIYDMTTDPGEKITDFNNTEKHITKFKVVFTDEGLVKLNKQKGGAVQLKYYTTASYKDQQAKTNWKFSNRGEIPGHHKDAEFVHYKNLTLEKLSSATGPDTKNLGGYYNYGKNGIVVDKADGVIYYRVTFYIPSEWDAKTAVELTDTFPAGLTYKDGSVSARLYGSDDDIKTQVGLTATASTPEDAGDGQTKVKFTVKGFQPGYTYLIYYQATFDEDSFWAKEDAKQKEYENKVEWNGYSDTTKTTVEKDAKVLKKDGVVTQEKDDNGNITGNGYITYHLTVNPGAANLDSNKDTLTLTDTIGQDQSRQSKLYIDTSSIKVYQYDPSMPYNMGSELNSSRYMYQYDEKNQKLTLTIPDELACVVSYRYNFEAGKNNENITNSAELSGDVTNKDSTTQKVEGSTSKASTTQNKLIVYKVDSTDDKVRLEGVTFELYEYCGKESSTAQDYQSVWKKVEFKDHNGMSKGTEKVTDENGEISFTTIDDTLKTNTVYKLVETSVGDNTGYSVSDKTMCFVFPGPIGKQGDENYIENPTLDQITAYIKQQFGVGYIGGADNITLANGIISYYFKDEQKGSIKVNKVWLNADGKDMNDPSLTATVRLMRKYQQDVTTTTTTQLPTVNATVHIKNKDGQTVTRTVPVVKNNPDAKIFVTGNNSQGTLCYPDASGGKDENNELGKASLDHGGWSSTEYYLPVGSQSSDGVEFTIVGNSIGWDWMSHINLISRPETTQTTTTTTTKDISERAKDADGNDIPDQDLTSDTNWSHMWTNLPEKDSSTGKQYYYYIDEVSVNGFKTTYVNNGGIETGTILVTNQSKKQVKHLSFDFNKKWTDEADSIAAWAKDITVTLSAVPTDGGDTRSTKFTIHQNKDGSFKATKVANSDVKGGITSYTISGSQNEDGSYKLKFIDLPDGYIYSVTEDKADGYNTPTYSKGNSAGQGETITNSPETATIDFKFSKKWSEGAWPDGVESIPFTLYKQVEGGKKTKVADFTVKKDGKVSGDNGYNFEAQVKDNVTNVTVKDLPTKDSDGKSITYTVEEGKVDGYTPDKESVGNGGTITNSPATGALKLTKKVTVNGDAVTSEKQSVLTAGEYTFTVKGPGDSTEVNKTVKITVDENGTVTAATVDGQSVLDSGYALISDLKAGEYTIEETKPTNGTDISKINDSDANKQYSTTVTVKAGDTAAAESGAQATFTNNINTGDLKLEKQVV